VGKRVPLIAAATAAVGAAVAVVATKVRGGRDEEQEKT
jgi:hypothetical protein